MNATSSFPAEAQPAAAAEPARRVLVWDAPVRVFHWLAVLSFAGAWITAESERWRLLHVTLGYTLAGLVAFRLVWGLVGTRHARFASFVRGPKTVYKHLRDMVQGRYDRHAGHNPAGALAIVALLAAAAAATLSGWALFDGPGGDWLEDVHELAADTMMALVGLHLAGVALASWMGRDNLVGAMFSGRKDVPPADGIRSAWRSVAALMVVAVAGFWVWQWQHAPVPLDAPGITQSAAHGDRDRDRDGDDD